jgi:DNA-binding transcriptional MerR regulator
MSHGSDNQMTGFTIDAVANAIGVSARRVRHWVTIGLVEPSSNRESQPIFDLHQLQTAKLVADLSGRGKSLKRIKQQFDQLRERSAIHVPAIGFGATLFVRDRDGNAIEWSGQRDFDFADETDSTVCLSDKLDADELFQRALACEDDDRLEEAALFYRRALELEPADANIHFNLANVLFGTGDVDGATRHYKEALGCDPDHRDALNNLEVVLAYR